MNIFRSKKKVKGEDGSGATGTKNGKKWPKERQEDLSQIDISASLPSTDDFRTSLIMSSLLARFSVLRVPDDLRSDLNSNDAGVIPEQKPQSISRHGDLNSGLSDIDEVSSIMSAIRPPFAYGRQNSIDGYGTDDESSINGSVMNRPRPGDGNMLFGGRQKFYKVPAGGSGSSKNLPSASVHGTSGRALYDDDDDNVSQSAFQKKRQEREEQRLLQAEEEERAKDAECSPLSICSNDRDTSFSINSDPSNVRSSTAATSVTSQGANSVASSPVVKPTSTHTVAPGLDRSTTKGQRLYEQGLNQHMKEQQSSAMSRLDLIQRQRTRTCSVTQAKSTTNLNDRYNCRGLALRALSPPRSAPLPKIPARMNVKEIDSVSQSTRQMPIKSPLASPQRCTFDEEKDSSAASKHVGGQVNAAGAVNGPKKFDEMQYLERQVKIQHGKETHTSSDAQLKAVESTRVESSRGRTDSSATLLSESPSLSKTFALTVFRNDARQIRVQYQNDGQESMPTNTAASGSNNDRVNQAAQIVQPMCRSDEALMLKQLMNQPAPSMLDHPAFRPHGEQNEAMRIDTSAEHGENPLVELKRKPENAKPHTSDEVFNPDGPVKHDFYNPSTKSSNSDADSPLVTQKNASSGERIASDIETSSCSISSSNAWCLGGVDGQGNAGLSGIDNSNIISCAGSTKEVGQQLPVISDISNKPLTMPVESREIISSNVGRPISTELETDMEKELEAFSNELAQRQRAIQMSLQNKVNAESRSVSPIHGRPGGFKAFGRLRLKSSRESMIPRTASQARPMVMPNLGGASLNASSSSLAGSRDRVHGRDHSPFDDSLARSTRQGIRQQHDHEIQVPHNIDIRGMEWRYKKTSYESSQSSARARSSSELSSIRSRSQNGRYKDDLEKAMVEGTGSSGIVHLESGIPGFIPQRATPDPVMSAGIKGNGKSANISYLEQRSQLPIRAGQANMTGATSCPSPSMLNPAFGLSNPSPSSNIASAGGSRPFPSPLTVNTPASSTPALFSRTPMSATFPNNVYSGDPKTESLRKKSIAKNTISEPVFISSTSVMETVELPSSASLKNRCHEPPPLPPINPRRRYAHTRINFPETRGDLSKPTTAPQSGVIAGNDLERTDRQMKLRKSLSEGRSLNLKSRQQLYAAPSVNKPQDLGANTSSPYPMAEGVMF